MGADGSVSISSAALCVFIAIALCSAAHGELLVALVATEPVSKRGRNTVIVPRFAADLDCAPPKTNLHLTAVGG